MTSTVATDIPQPADAPAKTLMETWGLNEPMRHIPPASWIVRKVDGDLRRRIEIVCESFDRLEADNTRRQEAEHALTSLCRSLDRLAEMAKHGRVPSHPGASLTIKVRDALHHAVTNLHTLDESLFGRRYPFQTLERSKAEPLVGCLLAAIDALHRCVAVLRDLDPGLDERLLEGLVTLQQPLRQQPIA